MNDVRSAPATAPEALRRDPEVRPSLARQSGRIAGRALPLYLSMLATTVGGMVTAAVLGRTDTRELAAHALIISIVNPLLMVAQGSLRGAMPFVAENDRDPAALARVVRDGTWLALCAGVLGGSLVASIPWWAPPLGVAAPTLAALGPSPALMGVFVAVASVRSSADTVLIGLGRTRTVLALSLVSTTLTVTLTPALILGAGPLPALGLSGAGVTMLFQGTVGLVLGLYASRRRTLLRGHRVGWGPPGWPGVWRIARVGLPSGATLVIKFGAMSVLALAVARVSAQEAAAHQLLVVVATFAFLPAVAVGQSLVPAAAKAAARRDRAGVRRTVLAGYAVAVPVAAGSAAALWTAAGPLMGLLTSDPRVGATAAAVVPVLCVVVVADALQVLPGMGLLGIKHPRPSMYAFAACYGLLALAALPLARLGGLPVLWSAYAVTTCGLVVAQATAFRLRSARV
ncbi:MATE family efflux transporter [Nocardiopsis aegyptia]|uniref:Probable multidrug resistance protein NorM n=1 Tax=Nocardiopsis aegyptia TaxID=220378 RepID=A0A7Z0ETH4_9ACTN|nr:MATE family efflux transporter [Nocardiopsis aegyptia]NYJ37030.1 MATE family multidrug resistance protein [Nocardiopsis aegyptia]